MPIVRPQGLRQSTNSLLWNTGRTGWSLHKPFVKSENAWAHWCCNWIGSQASGSHQIWDKIRIQRDTKKRPVWLSYNLESEAHAYCGHFEGLEICQQPTSRRLLQNSFLLWYSHGNEGGGGNRMPLNFWYFAKRKYERIKDRTSWGYQQRVSPFTWAFAQGILE